uniref:SFRICE_022223 n=1 Tax=Spodoptera frugiperda TaxID=7108 RepID=A0A2H1WZG7_SPOFR
MPRWSSGRKYDCRSRGVELDSWVRQRFSPVSLVLLQTYKFTNTSSRPKQQYIKRKMTAKTKRLGFQLKTFILYP